MGRFVVFQSQMPHKNMGSNGPHPFELASRMQLEATDAFDISREPESIRRMYGEGAEARQILIARRLVERGVRFVQAWVGSDWDHHQNLEQSHRALARQCDQAIAAHIELSRGERSELAELAANIL